MSKNLPIDISPIYRTLDQALRGTGTEQSFAPLQGILAKLMTGLVMTTYETAIPHVFAFVIILLGVTRVIPGLINYYGFEYFSYKRPYLTSLLGNWFLVTILSFVLKMVTWQLDGWSLPSVALMLVSLYGVLALDLRFRIIPDRLQVLGLAGAVGFLISLHYSHAAIPAKSLFLQSLTGLGLAAFLFLCNVIYEQWRRKSAMGLGDIKLLAWLGLAVGFDVYAVAGYALAVALAVSLIMLLLGKRRLSTAFAFGPYIVLGYVVTAILPCWKSLVTTLQPWLSVIFI